MGRQGADAARTSSWTTTNFCPDEAAASAASTATVVARALLAEAAALACSSSVLCSALSEFRSDAFVAAGIAEPSMPCQAKNVSVSPFAITKEEPLAQVLGCNVKHYDICH